jgi:uroporphyrinogen-III synthase
VTRSREQASDLTRRLRALGASVIEIPAIAIVPPQTYDPLDQALRTLHTYDWLIVTSANTARVIEERRLALGLTFERQPRTVAVGRATAAALEQIGLRADLVPMPAVAESIVAALSDKVAGQRVLLARAEVAREMLPEALEAGGAEVTIVSAYRTVLAQGSAELVATAFGRPNDYAASARRTRIDALTFTSSSTVKNLFALLQAAGLAWPAECRVFSIGPVTSGTLREYGVEQYCEAPQHDVEGLVAAVLAGLATSVE